ncbi:MAG: YhcH/YjgK/YiaL family protein [Candidatus Symbiothrix sp.]|jgi:YhcH/YjgK/YiaL family protein|nr:YhcH/YjgK/YiaL family protein [Candidatus Symbiothrix sp.]
MAELTKTTGADLDWFEQGNWKEGWTAEPDESINREVFIRQYAAHPERWQKAFRFLATTDLKNSATGRYELDGSDVYVNISEYVTKDEKDAKCEAHHQYVDIQYLISGEEQISVVPLADTKNATPYNEEKDIYFIQADYDKYYLANPDRFFIFFPDDAHRPCVKVKENAPVKKAVVKLKIN